MGSGRTKYSCSEFPTERYDQRVGGEAMVRAERFSTAEALAAHVKDSYRDDSWVKLLDAGAEHDAELYAVWMPERIRRDFDDASIYRKDLARYTGQSDGHLSQQRSRFESEPEE